MGSKVSRDALQRAAAEAIALAVDRGHIPTGELVTLSFKVGDFDGIELTVVAGQV